MTGGILGAWEEANASTVGGISWAFSQNKVVVNTAKTDAPHCALCDGGQGNLRIPQSPLGLRATGRRKIDAAARVGLEAGVDLPTGDHDE